MKKILLLIVAFLIFNGCTNKEKTVDHYNVKYEEPAPIKEETLKYEDFNNTDIGIYYYENGSYNLVKQYKTIFENSSDVVVFDIYPSSNDYIEKNNYLENLYNIWTSLDNYDDLKIGFNLKYKLDDGKEISYNILDPDTALNYDIGHIYAWLYDDYKHRFDSWYSHIEQEEFNSGDKLFTSIKIYANNIDNIVTPITFTVFTYDSEDDIDENGNYRGNSSYSIEICDINKTC